MSVILFIRWHTLVRYAIVWYRHKVWTPMCEVKLPRFQYLWDDKNALNHTHPCVVQIYIVTLYKHTNVCWCLPGFFLYLMCYMQNILIISTETLCVCEIKKANYVAFYELNCYLVIMWYLVYFTLGVGHTPQDFNIIIKNNVFCLLLVRPLSMSSNEFVNGTRMSATVTFVPLLLGILSMNTKRC